MPLLSLVYIKEKLGNVEGGIYFLCGDEDYGIEEVIKFLRTNSNVVTFYANKCTYTDLWNEYYQPSIFNNTKVILVYGLNDSSFLQKDNISGFIDFLQHISVTSSTNILVFIYNKKLTPKDSIYTVFENYNLLVSNVLTADKKVRYLDSYCKANNINVRSACISVLAKEDCSLKEMIEFVNLYNTCGDVDEDTFLRCFVRAHNFDALDFMIALANKDKTKICSFLKTFINASSFEVIPFCSLLYTFFLKTLLSKYSPPSFLYKISVRNYPTSKTLEILRRIKYLDESLKGLHCSLKPFSNILFLFRYIFEEVYSCRLLVL